jgi:murein L,D-transpeptidase YcbB/YkuD
VLLAAAAALTACRQPQPPPTSAPTVVEPAGPPAPEVQASLRTILDAGRHPFLSWPDLTAVRPDLEALYGAEPDGLFWHAGDVPHPALAGTLAALARSDAFGLEPGDYDAERLLAEARTSATAGDLSQRAAFDVAVSVSAMRLLQSVRWGRVDPRLVGFDYDVTKKRLDLAMALRGARDGKGLEVAIASAEPQFPVYRRLVKALERYRELAVAEPPPVPALEAAKKKLVPGDAWGGVAALAARLKAFGDLPETAPAPAGDELPLYAGELVEAVRRFQGRHALEPDGVLGASTIAILNVPAATRARQIELALERERWLPELREEPHLFVNVPLFRLWGFDPARPDQALRMNVVVGKTLGHQTPIFVEQMEYVIFRPYWNPPPSIVRSEIVPKARRDPSYLDRQDMEIVASGADDAPALPVTPANLDAVAHGRLAVRQRPGEKNALGLAKFIFPNAENVYMHGTPAQSLFARARRDFSHGCIRLEDPAQLGEWVLRDQPEWTRERIDAAMRGQRPTRVNLKQKLTVFLFYDTAYVDSHGQVHFADDYYGHDARLEKALAHGYPYPRAANPEE